MVKYAPATLDTIRQRVSLEQAAEYLHLSPLRGRYFCPFCQPTGKADHHTPDMGISNGKGFHCFKCGKSGSDVFALVQAVQGVAAQTVIQEQQTKALVELAVAPRIVARENLALWHRVGSGMYLLQWLCAAATFWRLSSKG